MPILQQKFFIYAFAQLKNDLQKQVKNVVPKHNLIYRCCSVVVTQCRSDVCNPELQGYALFLSVCFDLKILISTELLALG